MSTFKLLIKEQRVIEMERQVQARNVGVVSYDYLSGDLSSEEEIYDRLIDLDALSMHDFIMTRLCPRQRAEFWTRVSVVNAYEFDDMDERNYMANFKIELYTKYLSQQ
jgi:hypothetical protein